MIEKLFFFLAPVEQRTGKPLAKSSIVWEDCFFTLHYQNWYLPLPCAGGSVIKGNSAQPPPCEVDRWVGGSLTRRQKGPFAVSWPRQLGE